MVDDTFSHRFLRDRFRQIAASAGVPFVPLFVDTPLVVIEARLADNARTLAGHHIAPDVFARHRARFQFLRDDEQLVRLASAAGVDRWLAGRGRASVPP